MMKKNLEISDRSSLGEGYATTDLSLASSLVALGYEIHNLERTANSKKVRFIFRASTKIDASVNDYWNDRLKINARTLFDSQKMIKNRLYSDGTLC